MINCSITTSFLGCLVSAYLFWRYTWFFNMGAVLRSILIILFVLIGCIPLLVEYGFEKYLGRFYGFYRYTLYYIFIASIILFTLTIIGDIVLWGINKIHPLPVCYQCWVLPIYMILSVLVATYALYAGTSTPKIKTIDIASEKIHTAKKIAFLSDIHVHRVIDPDKVKEIVERTNAQNPDIIILGGDIVDDNTTKVKLVTELLKGLKAKNGIYFVTGNHEFYAGYKESVSELTSLGFKLLENSGVDKGDIYLAGIPDTFSGEQYGKHPDLQKALQNSKKSQYKLLISHTPNDFDMSEFDMEISGHTHGGQIFPFHIFAKFGNKYLSGMYKKANGSYIYVSNGAGQWGPQMRFLAPSEITILNFVPQTSVKKEKTK